MGRSALAEHWLLDPGVIFLNHGSFGACPKPVLDLQTTLRERMEQEPVTFLVNDLEPLLDRARAALAQFLGADAADLAFVPNATTGFNAVLRSLHFSGGDELLATTHGYNAARNALEYVASRSGARVVYAQVPFPIESEEEVIDAIMSRVTERTRFALIDHVTSPTALIFPISELVELLEGRGVQTLVDGAHGPGMIPLDLRKLGASYYTGNCHKWVSAPKGAGFLFVRPDRRHLIHPAVISHGANSPRADRSRYLLEFDWTGTHDPTPYLCIPAAIEFLGSLADGSWPAVMRHNHGLALQARDILCARLKIPHPAPDQMLGSMATVPLPEGPGNQVLSPLDSDPLHHVLFDRFRIEVPVWPWPQPPKRALRISAHLYNDLSEYETLAAALEQVV